ncbi:hypothetical protein [Pediococcus acidilactici]|uniref:hypothetical protein n=1 Tax=Pediococcus acidilactici TaxID=1254 RepID=UPI003B43CB4E
MKDANGKLWLFDVVYDDTNNKSVDIRQTLKNMAGRLLQGPIEFKGRYYSNKEAEDLAHRLLDIISIFDHLVG